MWIRGSKKKPLEPLAQCYGALFPWSHAVLLDLRLVQKTPLYYTEPCLQESTPSKLVKQIVPSKIVWEKMFLAVLFQPFQPLFLRPLQCGTHVRQTGPMYAWDIFPMYYIW